MERTAALPLAGRIETQWFGRLAPAQLDTWIETLCDLDEGVAGTTYARLRTQGKPTITPAEFVAYARTLTTTDGSTPRSICGDCDNTGWTQAPDRIEPTGRTSTQVQPCRCPEGRQRSRSRIWTERNPSKESA